MTDEINELLQKLAASEVEQVRQARARDYSDPDAHLIVGAWRVGSVIDQRYTRPLGTAINPMNPEGLSDRFANPVSAVKACVDTRWMDAFELRARYGHLPPNTNKLFQGAKLKPDPTGESISAPPDQSAKSVDANADNAILNLLVATAPSQKQDDPRARVYQDMMRPRPSTPDQPSESDIPEEEDPDEPSLPNDRSLATSKRHAAARVATDPAGALSV